MSYQKFKLIIISLVVLMCKSAFGQDDHKLVIGVHAAPAGAVWWNNNSFRKDFGIQDQPKLGFIAGLSAQYNLKPRFALALEANFERKGDMIIVEDAVDDLGNRGTAKQNEKLSYLTFPITAKFKLNKNKVAFYANVGAYIGYLIKYDWTISFNEMHNLRVNGDVNTIHRFDYGLVTGFGCDIPVKERFQFSLELRNNFGLSPLNDRDPYDNSLIRNESFALLFGVAYKI